MMCGAMTRKALIPIAMLLLLASCQGRSGTTSAGRTYRIGYMICNSEQETLARFRPLTAFLSKKLGVNFEAKAIDTIEFTKEADKLDFTHTNSLLYIILHRNFGTEILAAEKAGSLGARAKGLIVALNKSGLRNVRDLKGRTMVFGPMLGPTSFMAQLDLLLKNKIDPENDLASYTIPGGSFKHEKVIYGVLFGKFAAGAAPLLDFERMAAEDRIDRNDFVVLAESEPMPYCNFGVTQKTDEALARKFRDVLLSIKKEDTVELDGEVVKVLERAGVDGYEVIRDGDFDVVREMAKRTNMPPYQRY